MSDTGLADSVETLLPHCGALSPFSQPGGVASGEPEALLSRQGIELLREEGVWGEEPLPWFPEKMRLSLLLLRVSRGMSLERNRPPLRGEPNGGVTHGLEQRWGLSRHLDLVEVTSMYFISKASGSSFLVLEATLLVGSAWGPAIPEGSNWKVGSSSRIILLRASSEKSMQESRSCEAPEACSPGH